MVLYKTQFSTSLTTRTPPGMWHLIINIPFHHCHAKQHLNRVDITESDVGNRLLFFHKATLGHTIVAWWGQDMDMIMRSYA